MPNLPNLVINSNIKMLAAALFLAQTLGSWKLLKLCNSRKSKLIGCVNPKLPFVNLPHKMKITFSKFDKKLIFHRKHDCFAFKVKSNLWIEVSDILLILQQNLVSIKETLTFLAHVTDEMLIKIKIEVLPLIFPLDLESFITKVSRTN